MAMNTDIHQIILTAAENNLTLLEGKDLHQDSMVAGKTTPDDVALRTTHKNKSVLLGSAAIIIFVGLMSSLTYQLGQLWVVSGNFWQQQWDRILYTFGCDPYGLMVYGTTIIIYLLYWIIGGLYTIMDVFNEPAFLRHYKMQPGTNEPVDLYRLIKCIFLVNFNQIVIGIPFSMVHFYFMTLRGYDQSQHLPTFGRVLVELIGCIILHELSFYYTHRLLHHRLFYKRYHKMHHDWQSPIAITALYSHPLEHVVSTMGTVFLGPLVFGSHTATFWLWCVIACMSTLNAHSGYHLPFFSSPEAHDFHHLKFNQCFGVLGLLDLLHGTDDKFRASKSFSRHFMILSLTPLPKGTHS